MKPYEDLHDSDELRLARAIRNDCPANHSGMCFITGVECQFKDKFNCPDFRNYVPKHPINRDIAELHYTNRLGNPMKAISDGLEGLG